VLGRVRPGARAVGGVRVPGGDRVPRVGHPKGAAEYLAAFRLHLTKIVHGWPKLWAKFRDIIGIFSQNARPSLTIWVNPVQFSLP
jgi:hypothetical protein